MKRKQLIYGLSVAAVYFVLLFLLVSAESSASSASITGLGSALWYSLTTLTTVGYGDTYPVTVAGRLIGTVFQLLSIGILAIVITAVFSLIRGRVLPLVYLMSKRSRSWYIFSQANPLSLLIADALSRENKEAVFIFCDMGDTQDMVPVGVKVALSPQKLLAFQKGRGKAVVFAIQYDQIANDRLAAQLKDTPCKVCVMSDFEPDRLTDDLILFNPYDICARLYWHRNPLISENEKIILVGEGKYAEALLEQALVYNVVSPKQRVTYQIIGKFSNFRRNHPCLDQVFERIDSIRFSDGPWNEDLEVYKSADRIIFCYDNAEEAIEEVTQLMRYCPVRGNIYVRGVSSLDGIHAFGTLEEIYQPEYLLNTGLNELAVRLHRIYQDSVPEASDWKHLSGFLRRSNLASADHLLMKVRILLKDASLVLSARDASLPSDILEKAAGVYRAMDEEGLDFCRRIEHERWMRFHLMNNWQYAEKRDNARRLHPLLRPYDELKYADKLKDNYAWELIEKLI